MHDRDEDISWMLTAANIFHELYCVSLVTISVLGIIGFFAAVFGGQG